MPSLFRTKRRCDHMKCTQRVGKKIKFCAEHQHEDGDHWMLKHFPVLPLCQFPGCDTSQQVNGGSCHGFCTHHTCKEKGCGQRRMVIQDPITGTNFVLTCCPAHRCQYPQCIKHGHYNTNGVTHCYQHIPRNAPIQPKLHVTDEQLRRVMNKVIEEQETGCKSNECKICMTDLEHNFMIMPCGHAGYHAGCIDGIHNGKCPICNGDIKSIQQVFM